MLADDRPLWRYVAHAACLPCCGRRAVGAGLWVYHKRQTDRLAFSMGRLRVVLYDLRRDSPTCRQLNVLEVGAANRVLLTIPPFVVHGVQKSGAEAAQFVNMPTRAYDPAFPEKSRLAVDHPGIPCRFE